MPRSRPARAADSGKAPPPPVPPAADQAPPPPAPPADQAPPPARAKPKAFESLALAAPKKYLEQRIGLSVRVFTPGCEFLLNTPEGQLSGRADQFVLVRQNGVREIIDAEYIAKELTFLR